MKNIALLAVAAFAATFAVTGNSQAQTSKAEKTPAQLSCTAPAQPLREDQFVSIGGNEQWVTIRGDSCTAHLVIKDLLASGLNQGFALQLQVLILRRDTGITNQHG